MLRREDLERVEADRLSPLATKASESKGRVHKEAQPTSRTDFQRDRDRIIHSTGFRRMEYKTQVFVNHEGDHYRTRLTHSLEVAQIGRSVARLLNLNEDFMEALVLSHDIGHTPFGHSGERVMSGLMKEYGGFEHNKQSLRVVDVLEHKYPDFRGLNLTFEVREGIIKHSSHWKKEAVPEDLIPDEQPGLEAQLVDHVDEIAYNNHDIDDGLSSGMLTWEQLDEVEIWAEALDIAKSRFPKAALHELKRPTISAMITLYVGDLVQQTESEIKKTNLKDWKDVRTADHSVAGFSKEFGAKNQRLKKFLWNNMYTHPRVVRMEEKAKRILSDLFGAYLERIDQIPRDFRGRNSSETPARIVCDYIAGMTDRFALDEHSKLFDPLVRV